MKKRNFRDDVFRGTLAEVLEQGKLECADSETFSLARMVETATTYAQQHSARSKVFKISIPRKPALDWQWIVVYAYRQ